MNLAAIVEPHPGDAVALIDRGRTTTYGDLRRQVAELRTGLAERGVAPGDRVALVVANNWFFVVSYLAALGAGAVVVPLNPAATSKEIEDALVGTGAQVAVVGPAGRAAYAGVDPFAVPVERVLAPDGVRIDGAEPLEACFVAGGAVPIAARDADDLAVLMFTAGTAGAARAAMLTHGNLLANIEQSAAVAARAVRPGDVSLGVLPLFHIFGLNVVLAQALHAGASVVLVERFDPAETLELVQRHRVTIVAGAPTMYVAWATMPGAARDAMASVRIAASGAAPLPREVAVAFEERFAVPVGEGYGLTEASPVVSTSVGSAPRHGSVGVPLPGVEVRLVDQDGEDVLAGDPGEVWVRGPNVFAGYLDDPEATAAVLTPDGWLRTGDVAVADADGWLRLVDRAKDLVIVSGFNVYPTEVEEVLLEHPGIAEAVVVGVPDPYSGETVKAYVVEEPGRHLDVEEVIAHCAASLARYKCPTRVEFVEEIPRGLGGKALRRALRVTGS
jgi:long-chain acyl-CoA synthetase